MQTMTRATRAYEAASVRRTQREQELMCSTAPSVCCALPVTRR